MSAIEIALTIDSRLEQVAFVGLASQAWGQYIGLSQPLVQQIETCLVEAVNNAILHAYRNQPGGRVEVVFRWDDPVLTLEISDYGLAMAELPPDRAPEPLAESGRGWWILRQWMDEVDYRREGARNTVQLRLYPPRHEAAG